MRIREYGALLSQLRRQRAVFLTKAGWEGENRSRSRQKERKSVRICVRYRCKRKGNDIRKVDVTVNVGENYNIHINKKTYVVRMELLNPDTA